jgi:Zn-dependent M28 family amino/carboxypeptidase
MKNDDVNDNVPIQDRGALRRVAAAVRWIVLAAAFAAGGWYMIGMPGSSWRGPIPPLSAAERQSADNLRRHVEALAGRIGERNVWRPAALAEAAGYIRDCLAGQGHAVQTQSYTSQGVAVENLEVVLPGSRVAEEIVIAGAHYDSVVGSPAANDNGSGVAALLEIARLLAGADLPRSVRLVAFVNEEPPFFYGTEMGSRIYAERMLQRGEQVRAMLSLETIGYYTDAPASQRYPFPFRYFYPDTGNFVGFVGNLGSRRLVREAVAAFRDAAAFPSEGVAAPGWMTGVHWSDHWSFWQAGFPAIMVTDTALFRYPHYHSRSDTPEKLDYTGLARVTHGLAAVIRSLAGAGS